MTLHLNKQDYQCIKCSVLIIPYTADFTCPNCGHIGETQAEYLDFIEGCVLALQDNQYKEHSYIPSAWYIGRFSDQVQRDVFHLFSAIINKGPENIPLFIDKILQEAPIDAYYKKHIKDITLNVKAYFNKKEESKSFWKKLSIKVFARQWLRFLLP